MLFVKDMFRASDIKRNCSLAARPEEMAIDSSSFAAERGCPSAKDDSADWAGVESPWALARSSLE